MSWGAAKYLDKNTLLWFKYVDHFWPALLYVYVISKLTRKTLEINDMYCILDSASNFLCFSTENGRKTNP